MAHLIAGFPDLDVSRVIADGLVDGGAEFLEVQFPYSDPTADGPVIQAACSSALDRGFRVDDGFEMIADLAAGYDTPIFVMSYGGVVFARGINRFVADARNAGAAGVIIPDLMPGYDEGLFDAGADAGLAVVPVVAPSVSQTRLAEILDLKAPILYAAIRTGITGVRTQIDAGVALFLESVRSPETTLIAGFGVSNRDQARRLQRHTDVLVVGSAFVSVVFDAIGTGADIRSAVASRARDLTSRTARTEKEETPDGRGNP